MVPAAYALEMVCHFESVLVALASISAANRRGEAAISRQSSKVVGVSGRYRQLTLERYVTEMEGRPSREMKSGNEFLAQQSLA